jgi:hypothetical protein
LYQGRKKAVIVAKTSTKIQVKILRVKIFQKMYSDFSLFAEISFIVIAYNPKSTKNAKI